MARPRNEIPKKEIGCRVHCDSYERIKEIGSLTGKKHTTVANEVLELIGRIEPNNYYNVMRVLNSFAESGEAEAVK